MDSLNFILATPQGEERGYLARSIDVDMEVGDKNDFKFEIPRKKWDEEIYSMKTRIFIPNTEWGGIIEDVESAGDKIYARGLTWRGLFDKKIIMPPWGYEHLRLSGDINDILRALINGRVDGLYEVPEVYTGQEITIDIRYETINEVVERITEITNHKLMIYYYQPPGDAYGKVRCQFIPRRDLSKELEFSHENNVTVKVRDCRLGINHLVALGKGEGINRIVRHFYVQRDGRIGTTQAFYGLEERAAKYDYSSAEEKDLVKRAPEQLKKMANYKKIEVQVDNLDLDLTDIVSGYDSVTNTTVKKPITSKVLKIKNGEPSINYKVK